MVDLGFSRRAQLTNTASAVPPAPAFALLASGKAVTSAPDDHILDAWTRRRDAYRKFDTLPRDESEATLHAERDLWKIIDQAEEVIRSATAVTARGIEIQMWVSLYHSAGNQSPDIDIALVEGDLAFFEARCRQLDWSERLALAAIRSLRGLPLPVDQLTQEPRASADFDSVLAVYQAERSLFDDALTDEVSNAAIERVDAAFLQLLHTQSRHPADIATKLELMIVEYDDSQWDEDRVQMIADDARNLGARAAHIEHSGAAHQAQWDAARKLHEALQAKEQDYSAETWEPAYRKFDAEGVPVADEVEVEMERLSGLRCKAEDALILVTPAPDLAAVIHKIEISRRRWEFCGDFPDEWWAAMMSDMRRLSALGDGA